MTSETENLVLAQLRAIRATLANHDREFGELRARMSSVERQLASIHEDIAIVHSRLDGLTERVDRIERRLGIAEAPA